MSPPFFGPFYKHRSMLMSKTVRQDPFFTPLLIIGELQESLKISLFLHQLFPIGCLTTINIASPKLTVIKHFAVFL